MADTELQGIRDTWSEKYPDVFITLWCNEDRTKYFGKMMTVESSVDLSADSVGSLIEHGENFLRRIKM